MRTRFTTHYCIPTYEFPLTAENRNSLPESPRELPSAFSSGVIFPLRKAPGFHRPRLALASTGRATVSVLAFFYCTKDNYRGNPRKSQDFSICSAFFSAFFGAFFGSGFLLKFPLFFNIISIDIFQCHSPRKAGGRTNE